MFPCVPQDMLSADDGVLTDVLVYHKPPARRLPTLVLTRLLADVAEYVVEGGDGLITWHHPAFREASRRRYLYGSQTETNAALADYWCGRWAEEAKPPLKLARISEVLEAPSCGAPAQPARFGVGYSERVGLLDGPPNLRMLSERVPALLEMFEWLMECPNEAPPNLAYYRSMLEDSLTDPAFVIASLYHDDDADIEAAKLRLYGWAQRFEQFAVAERSRQHSFDTSPLLVPLFRQLKERTLLAADAEEGIKSACCLSLVAGYLEFGCSYAESLPLYVRALSISEKALGPGHPDTAKPLGDLAGLYQTMGCHADALPLFERALSIREKALGPEHPCSLASLD